MAASLSTAISLTYPGAVIASSVGIRVPDRTIFEIDQFQASNGAANTREIIKLTGAPTPGSSPNYVARDSNGDQPSLDSQSSTNSKTNSSMNKTVTDSTDNKSTEIDIGQLIGQRKFSEASTVLDTVLARSPFDSKAWFNYGICRQALSDYHGALAAYEMTCSLTPSDLQAKSSAEKMRAFIKSQSDAKRELANAALARQKQKDQLQQLVKEKNYQLAQSIAEQLLTAEPTDSELWFKLGLAKQGLGENHAALAAYDMATRLAATDMEKRTAAQNMRTFLAQDGTGILQLPAVVQEVQANPQPDFGPYLADLTRRIKRAWFPPKGNEYKRVTVVFKVHRDGQMTNLRMITSSGLTIADQAVLVAVEHAAPFRPLPAGSNEEIDVQAIVNSSKARPDKSTSDLKYVFVEVDRNTFRNF